jgi:hypothetical protein
MQKQLVKRGTLFFIGYLLSPLSLWDDVFVNIPISYVLALIVKHFSPSAFLPSMILIYWLTNLIGFLCMRKGLCGTPLDNGKSNASHMFRNDVIASLVYTFGLVLLVKFNVLQISF